MTPTTPEEINAAYRAKLFELAPQKPEAEWTGSKNIELALATISILSKSDGATFEPDNATRRLITALFDTNRAAKMKALKDHLSEIGVELDSTTEGLLDAQTDVTQMKELLAKLPNPDTKQPLVIKKVRRNRRAALKAAIAARR
jgi:hypothetical protein